MQHKKVIVGALVLSLLLGGSYAYSSGEMLQGKFGGVSVKTTTPVKGTSTSTVTKPDFYFSGAVTYDSGNNYFKTNVCQTNVTSSDVKQTSLKFSVARGQSATVQFTPTVAGSSALCQTVNSGDLWDTLLISQSGKYDVTATLDTSSVQTEASETNNTATTSGVVTASGDYPYLYDSANLPDLTVEDMYFDDWAEGEYAVNATVCGLDEILPYVSSDEVGISGTLSQNGVVISSDNTIINLSNLVEGESCTYNGVFSVFPSEYAQLTTGTVTMTLLVDIYDDVPESNEDNNGFGQSFTDEIVID